MFVSEETGKIILNTIEVLIDNIKLQKTTMGIVFNTIEELISVNKTQNNQIKDLQKKLNQIEQVIDNYHGTIDWSPFDKFEQEAKGD